MARSENPDVFVEASGDDGVSVWITMPDDDTMMSVIFTMRRPFAQRVVDALTTVIADGGYSSVDVVGGDDGA